MIVSCVVTGFNGKSVALAGSYGGTPRYLPAQTLVLVTSREPEDALYRELTESIDVDAATSIQRIGDCCQPGLIAHAVYAGHRTARELGAVAQAVQRDRALI